MAKNLNPEQEKAVTHTKGPVAIIAGAGTGKTMVIIDKIAYLLKNGLTPEGILALTFSRKAAGEMLERVNEELGKSTGMYIGTFHSFCYDIVRENPKKFNLSRDVNVLEEIDQAVLLHQRFSTSISDAILYRNTIQKAKDLRIGIEKFEEYIGKLMKKLSAYERDKNLWEQLYHEYQVVIKTKKQYAKTKEEKEKLKKLSKFVDVYEKYVDYSKFIDVWKKYEDYKRELNMLDFGDMTIYALDYLVKYGADAYSTKFQHILVDEFQDTNYMQYDLLKQLTVKHQNISVVGDKNQSIYGFRGAYTDNIDTFKKDFDKVLPIDLPTNYRSTAQILDLAYQLILNNYPDNAKEGCIKLMPDKKEVGEKVTIVETLDGEEESRWIAEEIQQLISNGVKPEEIAVLCRANSHLDVIKDVFENKSIPFEIIGAGAFFDFAPIKVTLAYLYVLNNFTNPDEALEEQSWWKILHFDYTLSQRDTYRIAQYKRDNKISLQTAIYEYIDKINITQEGQRIIEKAKKCIEKLHERKIETISNLVLDIFELSGMCRKYAKEKSIKNTLALLNLKKLYDIAKNYEKTHKPELNDFLGYISVICEMDERIAEEYLKEENTVKLMTVHQAKGLEFDAVFVPDMIQGRFPSQGRGKNDLIPPELHDKYKDIFENNTNLSEEELEKLVDERRKQINMQEERRVLYVAMTRAKRCLYLTFADSYGGKKETKISDFLREIGYNDEWRGKPEPVETEYLQCIFDSNKKQLPLQEETIPEKLRKTYSEELGKALDKDDFNSAIYNLILYDRLKNIDEKTDLKKDIIKIIDNLVPSIEQKIEELKESLKTGDLRKIKFDDEKYVFTQSKIEDYLNCPKQFELKHILHMPVRKEMVFIRGDLIHDILHGAFKEKIKTFEELQKLHTRYISMPEYAGVDPNETLEQLEVFWERNKGKFQNAILSEYEFHCQLFGYNFSGRIDRIDKIHEKEIEIIDYKTGKKPETEKILRQLVLYAGAMRTEGYIPKRLTLELLAENEPITYEIIGDKLVTPRQRKDVFISEMEKYLKETCAAILNDIKNGFAYGDEDACRWCPYKLLYCGRDEK